MTSFKRLLMTAVFLLASDVCLWTALLDWPVWVEVLLAVLAFVGFVLLNVFVPRPKQPSKRLRFLSGGTELLIQFIITVTLNIAGVIAAAVVLRPFGKGAGVLIVVHIVVLVLSETVIFWNGIVRVYLSSVQLGLRYRTAGILLGWIPPANIVMLIIICRVCLSELEFEGCKIMKNRARGGERVCGTKYPLLLVHGVFFRDIPYLNYWGRIPKELEENGARVFYGNQQSASSVVDSAAELARRIDDILRITGSEKVNIIAHSKGGLDSRYAVSRLGMADKVASLTTINTPHRGCIFAEYLLENTSDSFQSSLAKKYNSAMSRLGDDAPDFLSAVNDLTASACLEFNRQCPDSEKVVYKSVGSRLTRHRGGRFPLNLTYSLVKHFDGDNDGLVAVDSAVWGNDFKYLTVKGKRGISHADVIDLNRENIPGFDVREFYVDLVSTLKDEGF